MEKHIAYILECLEDLHLLNRSLGLELRNIALLTQRLEYKVFSGRCYRVHVIDVCFVSVMSGGQFFDCFCIAMT